jgi:hypothetical protein
VSQGTGRWSAGPFPPYVAVILDQPAMGPEWKSWLTFELALRGVLLGTDETLSQDGLITGFFRFLELEETEAVLRAMNVRVSALECPWTGPVRGAIGWIDATNAEDLLRNFLPFLARKGRGPLIRTDDKAYYEPVRRVTFSLKNLLGKFGFEDGEAFLNREPDYLEYARREAEAALERAGLEASVGLMEATAHNPLRIWGPILRKDKGKKVSDVVLDELSMTVWAYDDKCLQDATFWAEYPES